MAHVQGLRGLAIALVVLYHLRPELCPCGYFGVDLFLVISGFLIFRNDTTRHGTSRLGSYLLKKWWRIFPAVLLVCLPVFAYCLLRMHLERTERVALVLGGAMKWWPAAVDTSIFTRRRTPSCICGTWE